MLAAVLSLFVIAPAAGATVYVVNTTQDLASDQTCSTAPNGCTIRDAIDQATSADSISLPAGVFNLNPALGPLRLFGEKLNGAGARATIIDGGGAQGTRVMNTSIDSTDPQNPVIPQVAAVTVRHGNGNDPTLPSDPNNGDGGGIFVSGALGLVNSQVVANTANQGGGIGVGSGSDLVMVASTVAGNRVGTRGGGIWSSDEAMNPGVELVNSTVSGNVVAAGEGGGLYGGGGSRFLLFNTTVAGNQARAGQAILAGDAVTSQNSILASDTSGACSLFTPPASNNTIASDSSCGLAGAGDKIANPLLGPLQNNGGPTDTRAIGIASPAFNSGGAGCQSNDQRGFLRPQLGACDIGAFELRAARLTVVKRVVNNHGGTKTASDFSMHVRRGSGIDVGGSPKPGSGTGTTYTLTPGGYVVGEDADSFYDASISGACSANGVVTLAEEQSKTCTITNDDKKPVAGKDINGAPKRGTVRVKFPGDSSFHELTEGEQLPNNTIVDTRNGRITLYVAGKNGKVTHADFYEGLFKLKQSKKGKRTTTLTLTEKLSCKGSGKAATAARKRKRRRHLWGDGHGSFTTKGRNSAATVLGTKWLVQDTCTTTLTRVKRGKVKVRDFIKHKTVIVRKGHSYIARSKP